MRVSSGDFDNNTKQLLQEKIDNGHARRIGRVEESYIIFNRQKLYRNFTMFGELNKDCNVNQLSLALRKMCLKYPTLLHINIATGMPCNDKDYMTCYLGAQSHNDYVSIIPELKLEHLVIELEREQEHGELAKEMLREFKMSNGRYSAKLFELTTAITIPYADRNRPAWRLICLPGEHKGKWSKFIFVSNHCMCDGRSAVSFFHDLKDELNSLETEVEQLQCLFRYKQDRHLLAKLPEPIETRINFTPPLSFTPKFIFSKFVFGYWKCFSDGVSNRIDQISKTNAVCARIINFDAMEIQKIRNKVKANVDDRCTISPYLLACWFTSLYSWGHFYKRSILRRYTDLFIPIDFRPLLPRNEELQHSYRYGSNIGVVEHSPCIDAFQTEGKEEDFWRLVAHYKEMIAKDLKNQTYLHTIGLYIQDLIRNRINLDKLFCEVLLNKPRSGLFFSNVGLFPQNIEADSLYSIKDLIFGQYVGSFPYAFSTCVCSTDVGGMNIIITSTKDVIHNEKSFEYLCETFKTSILDH